MGGIDGGGGGNGKADCWCMLMNVACSSDGAEFVVDAIVWGFGALKERCSILFVALKEGFSILVELPVAVIAALFDVSWSSC